VRVGGRKGEGRTSWIGFGARDAGLVEFARCWKYFCGKEGAIRVGWCGI